MTIEDKLIKLSKSKFRNSFHLKLKDKQYINEKGIETIEKHAEDFIEKRLAPSYIANDGKQTPTRNHPVFIAQHATGTCCRKCLSKWHNIEKDKELTKEEQKYIVKVIMTWIRQELKNNKEAI